MKNLQINEVQTKFKEKLISLKKNKGLKNNEIAHICGRSESTVSELLNDARQFADALISSMQSKLNDYMHEGDLVTSLRQFTAMTNIAQLGKKSSDMRLIVGNTGIGKTVVFRKFASETENCYYFKVDRQYTWNKFLLELNRIMGLDIEKRTTNVLLDNIVRKVEQTAGNKPSLTIDEAEILPRCIWKQFKNLYTATEGLLNINIVGITEVKNAIAKMAGLEIVRFNKSDSQSAYVEYFKPRREENNVFTTFARRLKVFHIVKPSEGDIEDFCRTKGIVNKQVIQLAQARWWNYEMADTSVKRAKGFGFDLSKLSVEEFEQL